MISRTIQEQLPNDEIDPRELLLVLWESKALVLVITVIATLAAAAYVILVPSIYEVRAVVSTPAPTDIAAYNSANSILRPPQLAATTRNIAPDLTPASAYNVFLAQLHSTHLRLAFFKQIYLPDHAGVTSAAARAQLFAAMNQQLSIQASDGQDPEATVITWRGQDPNKISEWLNRYVAMARSAARDQLVATLQTAVKTRTQEIDRQINELRMAAAGERQRKLKQLEDALKIAKAVHITKPLSAGNLVASYAGSATYLRGSDALQAEIDSLKSRSDGDAYIPDLPMLLYRQHLLRTAPVSVEPLSAATVDQPAVSPTSPVQPRKLVIVLGGFLGLMLGVLAALIRRKMIAT